MKVVADNKIPFLKGVLDSFADVVYLPGNEINNKNLADVDALLVRTRTSCNEELLSGSSVKFIGTATIGFDHIDTDYCDKNNIRWTNAPGCNSSSVQQYITSALLKISSEFRFELKGTTIGIVGVGNVGSKVEKAARLFGMQVLLNDPPRERREGTGNFVSLEEILKKSDIITVHVPLNIEGEDRTYHLFNEEILKKMKRGAWFINSSRGEVVKTLALKMLLGSDKQAGAIIDVWENEPDIDTELLDHIFIATPHIAGYSTDGKANGTAMVVNSMCRYFGLPLKNWYPENIPRPLKPEIVINCTGKSDEDILREAVFHTYNTSDDDIKLRSCPANFEKIRGDYPLRREFPSFTLILRGCSAVVFKKLEGLGFRLVDEKCL